LRNDKSKGNQLPVTSYQLKEQGKGKKGFWILDFG
jgi:hypothetical protein